MWTYNFFLKSWSVVFLKDVSDVVTEFVYLLKGAVNRFVTPVQFMVVGFSVLGLVVKETAMTRITRLIVFFHFVHDI